MIGVLTRRALFGAVVIAPCVAPAQTPMTFAELSVLEGLHSRGVCENVIDKLMGGSPADHLDRYQAVSPMRLAPIGARQVLIVGVQDRSWGPVGRAYYAHAVAAGDSAVRLVEAPESGHFDIIAPPTTSWRLVVELVRTMFEQKRGRQR